MKLRLINCIIFAAFYLFSVSAVIAYLIVSSTEAQAAGYQYPYEPIYVEPYNSNSVRDNLRYDRERSYRWESEQQRLRIQQQERRINEIESRERAREYERSLR